MWGAQLRWLPDTVRLTGARRPALALLLAGLLLGLLAAPPAVAGSLSKADIQALFPLPLVVGERSAQLPAWPLFRRKRRDH